MHNHNLKKCSIVIRCTNFSKTYTCTNTPIRAPFGEGGGRRGRFLPFSLIDELVPPTLEVNTRKDCFSQLINLFFGGGAHLQLVADTVTHFPPPQYILESPNPNKFSVCSPVFGTCTHIIIYLPRTVIKSLPDPPAVSYMAFASLLLKTALDATAVQKPVSSQF